jgi:hypothetical protein
MNTPHSTTVGSCGRNSRAAACACRNHRTQPATQPDKVLHSSHWRPCGRGCGTRGGPTSTSHISHPVVRAVVAGVRRVRHTRPAVRVVTTRHCACGVDGPVGCWVSSAGCPPESPLSLTSGPRERSHKPTGAASIPPNRATRSEHALREVVQVPAESLPLSGGGHVAAPSARVWGGSPRWLMGIPHQQPALSTVAA